MCDPISLTIAGAALLQNIKQLAQLERLKQIELGNKIDVKKID